MWAGLFLAAFCVPFAFAQLDINGYKYAVIPDATGGDNFNVGATLRQYAKSAGLETFSSRDQLDEAKVFDACFITWSLSWWGAPPVGSKFHISVMDMASGQEVTRGSGNGWTAFTAESNLRTSTKHAWADLRYKRYNSSAHENNLKKLDIPKQAIVAVDEAAFRKRSTFAPIEGIWTTPDNRYVVIVAADEGKIHGDFDGAILSSTNPLWTKGELKMSMRETAVPDVFVGDYFLGNKQKHGVTYTIEKGALLKFTLRMPNGTNEEQTFIRLFPKVAGTQRREVTGDSRSAELGAETPKSSGSGTIVSAQGHVLTAAHVVAGATRITVVTAKGTMPAKVLCIDESNDVAVLKIDGGPFIPVPVAPSRRVRLGQTVATIGFPNTEIQGFSPKVTRGEISSQNGAGDDPRSWQVSVPVQPGNSGGPLLDENGNLIGIIVSKLSFKAAIATGDLPQNVNYAVKSSYALALLEPYLDNNAPEPNKPDQKQTFADMISSVQQSVVLVLVY